MELTGTDRFSTESDSSSNESILTPCTPSKKRKAISDDDETIGMEIEADDYVLVPSSPGTNSDTGPDSEPKVKVAEKTLKYSREKLKQLLHAAILRLDTPEKRIDEKEHLLWIEQQLFEPADEEDPLKLPRPKNAKQQKDYLRVAPPDYTVIGSLAEERHPWTTPLPLDKRPQYLIRLWDRHSKATMDSTSEGFVSGGMGGHMHDDELRKYWLEKHVNWGNRRQTPFISLSSNLDDIVEMLPRLRNRQKTNYFDPEERFTLINPNARIAEDMPLLHVGTEMVHYDAKMPYRRLSYNAQALVKYQYLATWCVPPSQIVGTWLIRDIEKWMKLKTGWDCDLDGNPIHYKQWFRKWLKSTALPALELHEAARQRGENPGHIENCACCGHK